MNIHEYQAKEIFESYDIPTPHGGVAKTSDEVYEIAKAIGGPVVVKAQVHVGGRGKAGGVKLAGDEHEARRYGEQILGMEIKGLITKEVLVVETVKIEKELYLGVILDRGSKKLTFMASEAGGMDIEEVASKTPDAITKVNVDPIIGLRSYHKRRLLSNILKDKEQLKEGMRVADSLYKIFMEKDCSLVEINPFAILKDGSLVAADAKINFDENALERHPSLKELIDIDSVDKNELIAKEYGLSYVALDGYVGCIVNGAGLAMATMDAVKLYKGEPANFLDVGGSSNPIKVVKALEIITSNKNVRSILLNIFGGITRCDDIANGLLEAMRQIDIKLPIVVRLTGTNETEARKILGGTKLHTAESMNEAVMLAVKHANASGKPVS